MFASAYHGHTQLLIDISSYKHDAPGADGPGEHAHIVSGAITTVILQMFGVQ